MDSVRSRWPILVYAFMVWTVFGSENTFPAIEFSIGKRAPAAVPLATTPATAVPAPSASGSKTGAPLLDDVLPAQATPAQAASATAPRQRAERDSTADAGRPSADTRELQALREAERAFLQNTPGNARTAVIPRPAVQALKSCEPRPADHLASRDWSRGFANGWPAGMQYPNLPIANDPRLARYIEYFTNNGEGRKTFATWLRRSGKYRDIFAQILERRQLPLELAAVAFVESGLWPTAVSKAGATGLWQFMPETARAYGLQVFDEFDERRSIWRSTEAAAEHLRDLFERLGTWELALAAYNMGYPRLSRAMQEAGSQDFWAVSNSNGSLPRETVLYVPKVLAVAIVLNNLSYFSFDDVEPLPPLNARPMEVQPGVALSVVARAAGTTVELLRELNPELPIGGTPNLGRVLNIYVPRHADDPAPPIGGPEWRTLRSVVSGMGRAAFAAQGSPRTSDWLGRLPATPSLGTPSLGSPLDASQATLLDFKPSSLETGRTVPSRALEFRPAESGQLEWISWGSKPDPSPFSEPGAAAFRMVDGRLLRNATRTSAVTELDENAALKVLHPSTTIQYQVIPGDSLWSIAKAYGTSERQIAKDNRLSKESILNAGRMLSLRWTGTVL